LQIFPIPTESNVCLYNDILAFRFDTQIFSAIPLKLTHSLNQYSQALTSLNYLEIHFKNYCNVSQLRLVTSYTKIESSSNNHGFHRILTQSIVAIVEIGFSQDSTATASHQKLKQLSLLSLVN